MKKADLKVGMHVAVVRGAAEYDKKPEWAGRAEVLELAAEYQVNSGVGFRPVMTTRKDGVRLKWIEEFPGAFSWKAPKTAGSGEVGTESILPTRYLWMSWDDLLKLRESHTAAAEIRQKRDQEQADKRAAMKGRLLTAGCPNPEVTNSTVVLSHEEMDALLSKGEVG